MPGLASQRNSAGGVGAKETELKEKKNMNVKVFFISEFFQTFVYFVWNIFINDIEIWKNNVIYYFFLLWIDLLKQNYTYI